jgi:hypothetical protein
MQYLVNHDILPIWLYVSYIVSNHGVAIDPNKIGTIVFLPIPNIVIEYVGHIGYYCRFIFKYSIIALSMTKLLRNTNTPLVWTNACTEALIPLK